MLTNEQYQNLLLTRDAARASIVREGATIYNYANEHVSSGYTRLVNELTISACLDAIVKSCRGAPQGSIYMTHEPDLTDCAAIMVANITNVYFETPMPETRGTDFLRKAGINVVQIDSKGVLP